MIRINLQCKKIHIVEKMKESWQCLTVWLHLPYIFLCECIFNNAVFYRGICWRDMFCRKNKIANKPVSTINLTAHMTYVCSVTHTVYT